MPKRSAIAVRLSPGRTTWMRVDGCRLATGTPWPASAASVCRPAIPSAARPCARWNAFTAVAVRASKAPVGASEQKPARAQQELEHGDVEADRAPRQVAPAEQRPAERPERRPRACARAAVDGEPLLRLEEPDGGDSAGPGDAVDRARVEAVRLQRDLQSRHLRVRRAAPTPPRAPASARTATTTAAGRLDPMGHGPSRPAARPPATRPAGPPGSSTPPEVQDRHARGIRRHAGDDEPGERRRGRRPRAPARSRIRRTRASPRAGTASRRDPAPTQRRANLSSAFDAKSRASSSRRSARKLTTNRFECRSAGSVRLSLVDADEQERRLRGHRAEGVRRQPARLAVGVERRHDGDARWGRRS